ncbi:MAG: peptidase U32 family protein [Bacillota bacterium]|jgi:putative protease
MKKPELLAPAGNFEKLKIAVRFGADAVYLGGKSYSLRSGADNFSLEEMEQGVKYAHAHHAKVYVTLNIFAHNNDLKDLPEYVTNIARLQIDGIIISDPGIFRIIKKISPQIPIHISTQANNTNWSSVLFWQKMGAKRVILARELAIREIEEIHHKTSIELEVFVHGAMCISYSGRCLLSNYLALRNANKGDCAHPCRWKYHLVEEQRPGQYFPVSEDDGGTYIFNSKDLCMIEHLPALMNAGVSSLKIEGRMKSIYYIGTVVKTYREAIDTYFADPEKYYCKEEWIKELHKVSHRHYTTGFAFEKPSTESQRYSSSAYIRNYDFVGIVLGYDPEKKEAVIEQRNRFFTGDEVEFVPPRGSFLKWRISSMKNEMGEIIDSAPHPQQVILIPVPFPLEKYSLMRRAK